MTKRIIKTKIEFIHCEQVPCYHNWGGRGYSDERTICDCTCPGCDPDFPFEEASGKVLDK